MKLDTLNSVNVVFLGGEDVTLNEGELLGSGSGYKSLVGTGNCCNKCKEKMKMN
jgi:hypothetical protein